jgi:hypothetical protein
MPIRPMEGRLDGVWGGAGIESMMKGTTQNLSPRSPSVFFWGLFAHPKSPRPPGEGKNKKEKETTETPEIPACAGMKKMVG